MAKRKHSALCGNNVISTILWTSVILFILLCCLDHGRAQVQNSRRNMRRMTLSRLGRRFVSRNNSQRTVGRTGEGSRTDSQRSSQSRGQTSATRSSQNQNNRRRLTAIRGRGRSRSQGRIRQEDVARGRVRPVSNDKADKTLSRLGSFDFFPSSINRFIDSLKDRVPNIGLGLGAKFKDPGTSLSRDSPRTADSSSRVDNSRADNNRLRNDRTISFTRGTQSRSRTLSFPSLRTRTIDDNRRSSAPRRATEPPFERRGQPTDNWVSSNRRRSSGDIITDTQTPFIDTQPTQPSFIDNNFGGIQDQAGQLGARGQPDRTLSSGHDQHVPHGRPFSSVGPNNPIRSSMSGNPRQDDRSMHMSNTIQDTPQVGQNNFVDNGNSGFGIEPFHQQQQPISSQSQNTQQFQFQPPRLSGQPQRRRQQPMPTHPAPNVQQPVFVQQPQNNQQHVQQPASVSKQPQVFQFMSQTSVQPNPPLPPPTSRPKSGSLRSVMEMITQLGNSELGIISRALELLSTLQSPRPRNSVSSNRGTQPQTPRPQNNVNARSGFIQPPPQITPQPVFQAPIQNVPVQLPFNPQPQQQPLPVQVMPVQIQQSLPQPQMRQQNNNMLPQLNPLQNQFQTVQQPAQGPVQNTVINNQQPIISQGQTQGQPNMFVPQIQNQNQISNQMPIQNSNMQGQFQSSINQLNFGNQRSSGISNFQGQVSNQMVGNNPNLVQPQPQGQVQNIQTQGQMQQTMNGQSRVANNQFQASVVNTNVNQKPTQIINQQTQIVNNQPNQPVLQPHQQPSDDNLQMVLPQLGTGQSPFVFPQFTSNDIQALMAAGLLPQNTNSQNLGNIQTNQHTNHNQALMGQLNHLQNGRMEQMTNLGSSQTANNQNSRPVVFQWGEGTTAPPIEVRKPAVRLGLTTPKHMVLEIDPKSRGLKLLPDGKGGVKVISLREAYTLSPFASNTVKRKNLNVAGVTTTPSVASHLFNTIAAPPTKAYIVNETLRKLEKTDRLNTTDVPEELEINGTSFDGNYSHPIIPMMPGRIMGTTSSPLSIHSANETIRKLEITDRLNTTDVPEELEINGTSYDGNYSHPIVPPGSEPLSHHHSSKGQSRSSKDVTTAPDFLREYDDFEENRMFPETSAYIDYPYYNGGGANMDLFSLDVHSKPGASSVTNTASKLMDLLKTSVSSVPSTLTNTVVYLTEMVRNTTNKAPHVVKDVAMKLMTLINKPVDPFNTFITTTATTTTGLPFMIMDLIDKPSTTRAPRIPTTTKQNFYQYMDNVLKSTTTQSPVTSKITRQDSYSQQPNSDDILRIIRDLVMKREMPRRVPPQLLNKTIPTQKTQPDTNNTSYITTTLNFIRNTNPVTTYPSKPYVAYRSSNYSRIVNATTAKRYPKIKQTTAMPPVVTSANTGKFVTRRYVASNSRYQRTSPIPIADYRRRRSRFNDRHPPIRRPLADGPNGLEERLDAYLLRAMTSNMHYTDNMILDGLDSLLGRQNPRTIVRKYKVRVRNPKELLKNSTLTSSTPMPTTPTNIQFVIETTPPSVSPTPSLDIGNNPVFTGKTSGAHEPLFTLPDGPTKELHLIKNMQSNDLLHANILNAIDTRLKTLPIMKRSSKT